MAFKRITMQDIADACGLSRNTVSKVFNGRGTIPEITKQIVLKKAEELGYFQIPGTNNNPLNKRNDTKITQNVTNEIIGDQKTIVLLTKNIPNDYHFGAIFLPAFTERLSRSGYTLTMYNVSEKELSENTLPEQLILSRTAGIITIELFDKSYLEMLSTLNLPFVSVDAFAGADTAFLDFDFVSMENTSSVIALTSQIIKNGAKNLGFVGDINHCNSFHERFLAFSRTLNQANLSLEKNMCILDEDSSLYGDVEWLKQKLTAMPLLPDAFVCANDFLAIGVMSALKQMNISVPEKVKIAGFDGIPQSKFVIPSLSTVQIPSKEIGTMTAELLLSRIANPNQSFKKMYIKTIPIISDSTL